MIRLEVEEYCQACMDFTPEVVKPKRELNADGSGFIQTDTIVHCINNNRCAGIRRYLERYMKGNTR